MRKLSTIMVIVLVAGLVAGLSAAVYAGNKSATAKASFGIKGNLSLKITNGSNVFFGSDLNPDEKHEKKKATTLKVETNLDMPWEISVSKSVSANGGSKPGIFGVNNQQVKDTLSVDVKKSSGTGEKEGIKVDYKLDNLKDLTEGFYEITVTYRVTAA